MFVKIHLTESIFKMFK